MLITLKEYADMNGITYKAVSAAITQKRLTPDEKRNGRWYIDENKKWTGRRSKKIYRRESKKPISEEKLQEILQGKPISYTRIYNIWRGMKQRCFNPNKSQYEDYGGRGITVCDEWKNDSKAFIKWAYANGYRDNLQIDRIDNNGNYEPDNCRWVTAEVNMQNRRPFKPRAISYDHIHYVSKFMA